MEQQETSGAYTEGAQASHAGASEQTAQAAHAPAYEKQTFVVNEDAEQLHKRKAQTAMILGIIGCVLVFYPVLSIGAIILGALALNYKGDATRIAQGASIRENGMNTAAFVTGLIALMGGILMTLLYLVAIICFFFLLRVAITEIGVPTMQSFFGYMQSMM